MNKQLMCTALAGASLLPVAADAHGFGRFGHGGGVLGLLLVVAVAVLGIAAVSAAARRF